MSGHRVTWVHERDQVYGSIICDEGEWGACRTICSEGCESWANVSEDGRSHCTSNDVVHPMESCNYCNVVEFITNDGSVEESYDGPPAPVHDGPVTPSWDGDTYVWTYSA